MRLTPVRWKAVFELIVALLLIWGAVAAFFASREHFFYLYADTPMPWFDVAVPPVVSSLIWATLTPFLLLAANYLAVKTPNRARNIGFLIVAAIFFGVLRVVVGAFTYYLFDPTFKTDWSRIVNAALVRSHGEILMAATIFAFVVVRDLYLDSRERERTALQLEARLARAQLQSLRAQLQPHFLFNTLNTIASLIEGDPEAAEKMIADLSDLLRRSLDAGDEQQVPLARELEFLDRYLGIQKMRFGARLRLSVDADPQLAAVRVPPMILQPLVENAITHAISPRREGGRVEVHAEKRGELMVLQVSDDGEGIPLHAKEGIGLGNTRARLEQLFGPRQTMRFIKGAGRFTVEVSIPLHA